MRYATAHLERNGLLSWEGFEFQSEADQEMARLKPLLRASEAAYLVRLTPPDDMQQDAIGDWLDQALDLLVTGPQKGLTIVEAKEGPQFRRLRSAS